MRVSTVDKIRRIMRKRERESDNARENERERKRVRNYGEKY